MSPRMLALALLCWSGTALAEDLMVIDAQQAPGLPVGTVVADGKAIQLPAGAQVLLVGASGKTVSLSGPYSGTPSDGTPKGDGKLMVALASLVKPKSEETGFVGATRDLSWRVVRKQIASEADVMALDAGLEDTQCVVEPDPKKVVMVLDEPKRAERVTIMSVETGAMEEFAWPRKTVSRKWPETLPLESGNTYLVDIASPASLAKFTVKVLPKTAANPVERTSQLIEAKCMEQARLMVELIKKTAR